MKENYNNKIFDTKTNELFIQAFNFEMDGLINSIKDGKKTLYETLDPNTKIFGQKVISTVK